MAGLLVVFWFLFQTAAAWVSVVFYLLGLIFGLLLISQFWTVANLVYNPRQAKRLFGFIGGGAPLGGMAGSALRGGRRNPHWISESAAAERGADARVGCRDGVDPPSRRRRHGRLCA
jgi:ATP/ADP translocase